MKEDINTVILKNAIRALTHTAIPDHLMGVPGQHNIRVPFVSGNTFAYFNYNRREKQIESIQYMKDERGEMVTIKL